MGHCPVLLPPPPPSADPCPPPAPWVIGCGQLLGSRRQGQAPLLAEVYTIQGNSHGKPCTIPFKYDNQWFHGCTSTGREDGHLWCATTQDYGKDERWGFCPIKSESRAAPGGRLAMRGWGWARVAELWGPGEKRPFLAAWNSPCGVSALHEGHSPPHPPAPRVGSEGEAWGRTHVGLSW